jgi:hypothetical protein
MFQTFDYVTHKLGFYRNDLGRHVSFQNILNQLCHSVVLIF